MLKYLFRYFAGMILTLLIIVTISFFVVRLAPGSPFSREKPLPPAVVENLEAKYGLDKPLAVQYLKYMQGLLKGEMGPSTSYPDYPVQFYIAQSIPHSLLLGIFSVALALFFGVTAGLVSAIKQNSLTDYILMILAVVGITIPLFVLGPVLVYFLALKWKFLPTSGWISSGNILTFIMPVITLSAGYTGRFARMARGSTLEVLGSNYIRTAKAKGLPYSVIVVKHTLKGMILPIVSYSGPVFAAAITGSVVVESIFRVPGVGRYFILSAINRDYFLLMGTVIVYAAIIIIMNFIADILYNILDPRIVRK